jgi:hypothetical protein
MKSIIEEEDVDPSFQHKGFSFLVTAARLPDDKGLEIVGEHGMAILKSQDY